jgi:hypothetical protein
VANTKVNTAKAKNFLKFFMEFDLMVEVPKLTHQAWDVNTCQLVINRL